MSFLDLIEEIPDPREAWKVKHSLSTILFTTLCGILCGAESWSDISDFCEAKQEWLSNYVNFTNGVPSAWTFRRVFTLLKPEVLEWLLRTHALSLIKDKSEECHIAIDGKTLCGSKRKDLKCLSSVSALCHEQGLILAEIGVKEKSNETGAIPLLIELLSLKDSTVTIDAAGCQQEIASKIVGKGGDYVLALKKNHPKFYKQVSSYLQENAINSNYKLKDYFDNGHGRIVRRRYFACGINQLEGAENWANLKSAIAVETISSYSNKPGEVKSQWRYYISSHAATNPLLPQYIINHWSIENQVHWVLDVHMKEDSDLKAERKSAKAFSVLRRIALNIVRTKDIESKPKRSLRRKFKRAGWDNDYLLKLLI